MTHLPPSQQLRTPAFASPPRRPRGQTRGFSLLELMVAIVAAGFLISAVYFASSRSSKTFQEQQRIAQTQLAVRAAIEQLRADASRAGFLASPNSTTDPFVCIPRPAVPIRAVRLTNAAGGLPGGLTGLNPNIGVPDQLELVGSFDTPEEFHAQTINAGSSQISVQTWTQGFRRACTSQQTCAEIFQAGRWLRVTNTLGYSQFVRLSGAAMTCPPGRPCSALTLTYAGTLRFVGTSAGCGITGFGTGTRIGVLSGVRYRIGQLASSPLAYRATSAADNTTLKSDLLRERFQLAGGPVFSSSIALEYAVELDVRYVVNTAALRTDPPNLVIQTSAASGAYTTPERVRSMIVRLSARTRDEDDRWPWVARAVTDPLTSVRLRNRGGGRDVGTRVRTIAAEIALPNLIGAGQ